MNGVAVAVHQSSRRNEKRKLVSITRSPSVAVVSEIAPRWITASSLPPLSQPISSEGGTKSASWRLARLRHLPSWPSRSETTTSARPASFNAATTFDPIKPAPPVTSNIPSPASRCAGPALPHSRRPGNLGQAPLVKTVNGFTCLQRAATEMALAEPAHEPMNANSQYIGQIEDPDDTSPILIVPYMWIGDFMRGHTVVRVLKQRWP